MGGASKDKKTLDRVDLKGKYGRWRSPDNGLLKEWIAAVPSTLPPPRCIRPSASPWVGNGTALLRLKSGARGGRVKMERWKESRKREWEDDMRDERGRGK